MGLEQVVVGAKFGRLTVTKLLPNDGAFKYRNYAEAKCSCGKKWTGMMNSLYSGRTTSCGCYGIEQRTKANIRHKLSKDPIFNRWYAMVDRCYNQENISHARYKNLQVCSYLAVSPLNLLSVLGPMPKGKNSIDRHPLRNGNYTCGQCEDCLLNNWKLNIRWASSKEQANNRNNNVILSAFGKTMSIAEWSDLTGLSWTTIRSRMKSGWPVDKLLTTPARVCKHRTSARGYRAVH